MTDIAVVVLAAGASQRFGKENKLLALIDGKAMLAHVLDSIASLTLSTKIVVVRAGDEEVTSIIDTNLFNVIENRDAADGMGSSIAAGIRECGDVDGAMLVLGDMPFVKQSTYSDLLAAFREQSDKSIVAPVCHGRRGHPVLFRRQHFDALMALVNDTGAKHIVASNELTFLAVRTNDAGTLSDIDVPSHSMT